MEIYQKKFHVAEAPNSKPFWRYSVILVMGHNVPPLDRVKLDLDQTLTAWHCHTSASADTCPYWPGIGDGRLQFRLLSQVQGMKDGPRSADEKLSQQWESLHGRRPLVRRVMLRKNIVSLSVTLKPNKPALFFAFSDKISICFSKSIIYRNRHNRAFLCLRGQRWAPRPATPGLGWQIARLQFRQ